MRTRFIASSFDGTPMSMNSSWIFGALASPSPRVRCGATLPTTPRTGPWRVWIVTRWALVMAGSMPPVLRTWMNPSAVMKFTDMAISSACAASIRRGPPPLLSTATQLP